MSKKRFKVVQDPRVQTEYFIHDDENKISENIIDYPFSNQDVCSRIVRLLNEYHEYIKELEKENRVLKTFEYYAKRYTDDLDFQNKRLKKRVKRDETSINTMMKNLEKLKEENKQLKEKTDDVLLKYPLSAEGNVKFYPDYFSRCEDCVNFRSYYFDEYDSDCYCDIFDELKRGFCKEFRKKEDKE